MKMSWKKKVCRFQIHTHSVVFTYELSKEPFLLMLLQLLPATSASKQRLNTKAGKRSETSSEVCGTEAMTNREWTKAKSELRHLTARYMDSTTECEMDNSSTPRTKTLWIMWGTLWLIPYTKLQVEEKDLSELSKEKWHIHIVSILSFIWQRLELSRLLHCKRSRVRDTSIWFLP